MSGGTPKRGKRAVEIVWRARDMIEREGGDKLTMRRLADEMGIQAPSLYKHFTDKQAITTAVHVQYLEAQREVLATALADDSDLHPLVRVAHAYRTFVMERPTLYKYLTTLPYPIKSAQETLRAITITWVKAASDPVIANAAYAFMRGMLSLEIHKLYPYGADPEAAYALGLDALVARSRALTGPG